MRSAEEFYAIQLKTLEHSIERAAMYTAPANCEEFFGTLLYNLCWFDDRLDDWQRVSAELFWGSMRVYGQFHFQHARIPGRYWIETVSIYAQAAHRLDYWKPGNLRPASELARIAPQLDAAFFAQDHTLRDMIAQLGEPSLKLSTADTAVHCYASEDSQQAWIYFDYSRRYPPMYHDAFDVFDEPILRDVRRERNRFEFLPFARWCETPSWWEAQEVNLGVDNYLRTAFANAKQTKLSKEAMQKQFDEILLEFWPPPAKHPRSS